MKNWKYIIGTFVLFLLWGVLVVPALFTIEPRLGPVPRTLQRIRLCYHALAILGDQERHEFLSALRTCKNPLEMNSLAFEYIARSPFGEERSRQELESFFGVEGGLIVDAWGRPLRLAVRGGYLSLDVFGDDTAHNLELIIWSCGPNGWDEWGHGDDVVGDDIPSAFRAAQ